MTASACRAVRVAAGHPQPDSQEPNPAVPGLPHVFRETEGVQMAVRNLAYPASSSWGALPGQETLRSFAAAFFALTLLTDWAYTQTMILMWKDFSAWLLFAGLVAGGFAVLLWLIGLAVYRRRPLWLVVVLNAVVLALAFVNSLVHAGDGWTAIMPWGLGLSLVTCLLMLVSATLRRAAFQPLQRI